MVELIKLVRAYRMTAGLADQLRLGEEICRQIEPDLRYFVFSAVRLPAAQDVLQETLKAIVISIRSFKGDAEKEFWAWCYGIARNKLSDQFRRQKADRSLPMPPEEIWQMVESSEQSSPLSPADKHDLDYAMKLLTSSKPECYDYLWKHFVIGMDYAEIAEEQALRYDAVRMKIGRCLETAQSLVS